jgi:hypothetical protein
MEDKALKTINILAKNKAESVIIKSNCKLCNSAFRQEAEETYCHEKSFTSVFRFLKSNNEEISIPAIRSHMMNHFVDVNRQEKMKEYVEDLEKWKSISASKTERLHTYLSIVEKRIFQLASAIDEKTDQESIKQTEVLNKLIDQASSLQSALSEETERIEPARIVIKKLQEIIEIRVRSSKSPELKNVLIDLVSDLQGNIGGLLENGKHE